VFGKAPVLQDGGLLLQAGDCAPQLVQRIVREHEIRPGHPGREQPGTTGKVHAGADPDHARDVRGVGIAPCHGEVEAELGGHGRVERVSSGELPCASVEAGQRRGPGGAHGRGRHRACVDGQHRTVGGRHQRTLCRGDQDRPGIVPERDGRGRTVGVRGFEHGDRAADGRVQEQQGDAGPVAGGQRGPERRQPRGRGDRRAAGPTHVAVLVRDHQQRANPRPHRGDAGLHIGPVQPRAHAGRCGGEGEPGQVLRPGVTPVQRGPELVGEHQGPLEERARALQPQQPMTDGRTRAEQVAQPGPVGGGPPAEEGGQSDGRARLGLRMQRTEGARQPFVLLREAGEDQQIEFGGRETEAERQAVQRHVGRCAGRLAGRVGPVAEEGHGAGCARLGRAGAFHDRGHLPGLRGGAGGQVGAGRADDGPGEVGELTHSGT
jgi:hypothetical protein